MKACSCSAEMSERSREGGAGQRKEMSIYNSEFRQKNMVEAAWRLREGDRD